MPIAPKDVAQARQDNIVAKIVESFDKRVLDPKREDGDIELVFHDGTSASAARRVGLNTQKICANIEICPRARAESQSLSAGTLWATVPFCGP